MKQKPRLRACERESWKGSLKLKGPDRSEIYLPPSYGPLIEAIDGEQTLGQIWRQIVIPHPELNLKDLLYLLSELERMGCLEDFSWEEKVGASSGFRFRISKIWLEKARLLFSVGLGRIGGIFSPLIWVLSLSSLGIYFISFFPAQFGPPPPLLGPLLPLGLYFSFWIAASVLKMAQSLFQVLTLVLGTGEKVHISAEIGFLHLRFRVHEEPVALLGKNKVLSIFMYLSWALAPLLAGGTLATINPAHSFWWSSVGTLLFLLELNPYRDSLCTRLLSRLTGPEDFHGLFLPYLQSSSFFSIFYRKRSLPRERQMVLYSSFSVAWSLFFLDHTLSFLGDNRLILAHSLGKASLLSSVDLVAFSLVPALLFIEILIELFGQLLGNSKFPLLSKFYALVTQRTLSNAHQNQSVQTDVVKQIASLDIFRGIDLITIQNIFERSSPLNVASGRRILVQGSRSDDLLFLLEGQLRIEKRDDYGAKTTLAYVEALHVLGETAALIGLPRQADAITQTPCKLLRVSGRSVKEILNMSPGALELFMERISLSHALASSKIFRNLPQEAIRIVAEQGVIENLPAHQSLLKEGDSGRDFYMLVKGQLEVTRNGQHVALISAPETFGEIALMREVRRSASISSLDQDCQVFRLAASPLLDILETHPQLALAIEAQADFRSETSL